MKISSEEVYNRFLKNSPELQPYYKKEKELLAEKELTEYLFFAYVVEEGIKEALNNKNSMLLKNLFKDIEWYIQNNNEVLCIDIIYTSLFEDLFEEFESQSFDEYMEKETMKLWQKYISTI